MDYKTLFDTVRRHLNQFGVACQVRVGAAVTEKAVAKAESKMKVRLPAELREFYQTVGDGISFRWESDSSNSSAPWASLLVPSLKYLADMHTGGRMALYSPAEAEKYGFPYTKDSALAKRTAARMWHWMPVIEEGDADLFCLDLGDPGCPVVYHRHDWYDGGPGDNGHHVAPNWKAYLVGWGSVCFQKPKDCYWPYCFKPGGGVDWAGEQFRDPYRIAGLA